MRCVARGRRFFRQAEPVTPRRPVGTAHAAGREPRRRRILCPHPDCAQPNPPGASVASIATGRCAKSSTPPSTRDRFRRRCASAIASSKPFPRPAAKPTSCSCRQGKRRESGREAVSQGYQARLPPACDPHPIRRPDRRARARSRHVRRRCVRAPRVRARRHARRAHGSGPLPKEDIRPIVREIADALGGIHAHGILHRDLKPENVLVRTRGPCISR